MADYSDILVSIDYFTNYFQYFSNQQDLYCLFNLTGSSYCRQPLLEAAVCCLNGCLIFYFVIFLSSMHKSNIIDNYQLSNIFV